jgi:hypothetical protein
MLAMHLQHPAMITEGQHEVQETIIRSTQQSCRTQTKISIWHTPSISFWPGLIHLESYKNCLKTTLFLAYDNMEFSWNRYNKWQAVRWGIGTRTVERVKINMFKHLTVSLTCSCKLYGILWEVRPEHLLLRSCSSIHLWLVSVTKLV